MAIVNFIKNNKLFVTLVIFGTLLWVASISLYHNRNIRSHNVLIELEVTRVNEYYISVIYNINRDLEKIEIFVESINPEDLTQERFEEFLNDQNIDDSIYINFSIAILSDDETELNQTYVYPLVGNEITIGHDLLNDDRDYVITAVNKALSTNLIVINGPYDLRQGGQGIIFRKSAINDDLVALVNIAADYDLLNEIFDGNESDVVSVGLFTVDNDIIFGELEYSSSFDYYEKIKLDSVDWYIGISESKDFNDRYIINSILVISSSILLYSLALIIVIKSFKRNLYLLDTQYQMINYDNLTHLPNRRLLAKDINHCIKLEVPFFLAFGDLDNFKNLNDILGHTIGDIYLKNIADKFNSVVNDQLTIYRWGGDEFIFLIKEDSKDKTIDILNRIYKTFHEPIIINDTKYFASMSVGIVKYPDQGVTLDDLVKKADIVMYDVKANQKNLYAFFEDKYLDKLLREVDFENKLNNYTLDDFLVYLQPIVDTKTNEIIGFEALSRLFDHDNNLINTGELVKYYERSGKIQELDRFTFRQVCNFSKEIKAEFNRDYMYTFNISPLSLTNDLIDYFQSVVDEQKVNPNNFVIEIIETIGFKDINESIALLNKLRDIGFKIAMDDFGIGYSSLSYITRLPLSLIKIDRMFVESYQVNEFDKLLILTIRDISKSLNLEIIVEGIETTEQLDFIKAIDCHYYQGFLHSKAMSFTNVKLFLEKEKLKQKDSKL
ncbi:MAG: EAL domain-containing protein [Candidatus Izemoplasma sp.]